MTHLRYIMLLAVIALVLALLHVGSNIHVEVLLAVSILLMALFWLYRQSRHSHQKCVQLFHRIANELSQRQEHELVVERIFNIIIEHTGAEMAILVYLDSDENKNMRVLRTHGIVDEVLKAGDHLSPGEYGYGFDKLEISNEGQLYHSGLKEAVMSKTGITLNGKQNMMCIPITSNQKNHGLLQLISSKKQPFSQNDIKSLEGMGIYLDAAIQNASKIEMIRRQRDASHSLYTIGLTISRFLELDEILHHAVDETRRLLQADFSWYMKLRDQKGDQGVIHNISGNGNEHVDIDRVFPLGGRIKAMLNLLKKNVDEYYILIHNLNAHEGEGPKGYIPNDSSEPFCITEMYDILQGLNINSGVIVPIASEHHAHGLLCSFSTEKYFFDNFHALLQQRIANQVLIAINTADYHVKARRLALVEERQRMSDDLHDNMAQVINGLSLELHSFIKMMETGQDKETLLKRLETLRPQLDQAKATIREGIFELRIPEGIGLWQNLADFSKRFEQWHNFKIHVDLPKKDIHMEITQQHELLRIVQESLWNIRKYSGTQEAWLKASFTGQHSFQIQVEDRGLGFSSGDLDTGQGIATMRDRISRLQGKLDISPNSPSGVIISLEVPYHVC